jgi:hypothetical protein
LRLFAPAELTPLAEEVLRGLEPPFEEQFVVAAAELLDVIDVLLSTIELLLVDANVERTFTTAGAEEARDGGGAGG